VGLERLYEALADFGRDGRRQVREYIDVGEYGLALEDVAYIYLQSAPKPLSAEIHRLFDELAVKMGMKEGDEWRGVAKIRGA
jgi:hypothetical protein